MKEIKASGFLTRYKIGKILAILRRKQLDSSILIISVKNVLIFLANYIKVPQNCIYMMSSVIYILLIHIAVTDCKHGESRQRLSTLDIP